MVAFIPALAVLLGAACASGPSLLNPVYPSNLFRLSGTFLRSKLECSM